MSAVEVLRTPIPTERQRKQTTKRNSARGYRRLCKKRKTKTKVGIFFRCTLTKL